MDKVNLKLELLASLILLCFLSMSCNKKGEESRLTPSTSSTASRGLVGVSAGSGLALSSGTQIQSVNSASTAGVKIEWILSDAPIIEKTNQGQKYFYVVNVVRVNGKDYEFPTIHYYSGSTPIVAKTGLFSLGNIDFDLDAECLDVKCSEYSFSVKIYKGSQQVQQLMVYIDFAKQAQPLVALNDKNYFMNFTQFYDLIRNYYN